MFFWDVAALLGTKGQNQSEEQVRVVGYRVDRTDYYGATERFDLSAEEVALTYKLRWDTEVFFRWWKQHLNVYPMIARSACGLMAQILGGLFTCRLLAIYCHEEQNEKVNIARLRELRIQIRNELTEILTGFNNKGAGSVCQVDCYWPSVTCKSLIGHYWLY